MLYVLKNQFYSHIMNTIKESKILLSDYPFSLHVFPHLAESGDTILEINVPLSPELTTWILGWKQYIKVLEPRELVVDVLGYLERIRGRYEE
jgi:hypothetical protein